MPLVYLLCLLLGIACMLLLDARFRLFFWRDPIAAAAVTLAGTVFFLLWDAAGIALGVFLVGDGSIMTGIMIAPELPLEEPVFLVFLVICTMVLFTGAERVLRARKRREEA
ncbi:lycopene cyclase domain-containing protein [Leucobacter weissii]|uniref:Lycopene cyclase domain-containing protein n=1 Tax=Leucobacter weissii TaxID=1983706 RepID=A0A939MK85_9MICO|nr:lycopene cyclase domain-containing protein [Leucobacter weissii]MBO1902508.1 lycopene cyclase domain-containing protein [Leucobacter weissii]